MISTFTCFDDIAQLIEQEFVVSSSVQALLHVAVELIHHPLHICVLVLLDTRHIETVTPQSDINREQATSATLQKINNNNLRMRCKSLNEREIIFLILILIFHSQKQSHSSQHYPKPHSCIPLHCCILAQGTLPSPKTRPPEPHSSD